MKYRRSFVCSLNFDFLKNFEISDSHATAFGLAFIFYDMSNQELTHVFAVND